MLFAAAFVCCKAKYDTVNEYSENRAAVQLKDKWGFIDENGKKVVPLKYDEVNPFQDGLARVQSDGQWGFIDKNGKEVVPLKYDKVNPFQEGLARVQSDGKWGFIDASGEEVIPCKYNIAEDFIDGLANVVLNGMDMLVNKKGYEIHDPIYEGTVKMNYVNNVRVSFMLSKDRVTIKNLSVTITGLKYSYTKGNSRTDLSIGSVVSTYQGPFSVGNIYLGDGCEVSNLRFNGNQATAIFKYVYNDYSSNSEKVDIPLGTVEIKFVKKKKKV
jgi:hypothetical protein